MTRLQETATPLRLRESLRILALRGAERSAVFPAGLRTPAGAQEGGRLWRQGSVAPFDLDDAGVSAVVRDGVLELVGFPDPEGVPVTGAVSEVQVQPP